MGTLPPASRFLALAARTSGICVHGVCASQAASATLDVESGSVIYCDIHFYAMVRPREPRGFQRLHVLSPNPNIYNNVGRLLSLKQQPQRCEQMEFGHIFGTAGKTGALVESQFPCE